MSKRMMLMLAAALSCPAFGDDWPKFLGPNGDQIVREKIDDAWPATGPKELWRVPMGKGFSSPIVKDGKLYINVLKDKTETLYALDAATGKQLWESAGSPGWSSGGPMGYPGTRATPAIDGEFIYTYSGHGELLCRKLENGNAVWSVDVLKDTKAKDLVWGSASSPAIIGDTIYVQGGQNGSVAVAINKKTGEYLWKSESGIGSYSTPVIMKVEDKEQLIVVGGKFVFALDPATGKTLWSHPWETYYQINAATPICRDGKIVVAGAYAHGALMLQASASSAKVVWETPRTFLAKFPTPILEKDVLIGNSEGTIMAIEWGTGKTLWSAKEKIGEGGSLLRVNDKLLATSDKGQMTLYKLADKGIEKVAGFSAATGSNIWSTPTISGGKMYVKGATDLACFDVSVK